MNVREKTVSLLMRYREEDCFINLLLSKDVEDPKDMAFLTTLLYGTVERTITLDYAIAVFCKKNADSLSPHTKALLEIGLYQIYFLSKIPAFAAVNETVSLAQHKGEASLVNGVLRNALKTPLPLPPIEKNFARYLSIKESFPLSIVKKFIILYGEENTAKLLLHYNCDKDTTIFVNPIKTSMENYKKTLENNGIPFSPVPHSPFGLRLSTGGKINNLPHYDDGYFFVQDEASQIAMQSICYENVSSLMDCCSAPGGKSFAAALLSGNHFPIISCDIHASKLSLIEKGAIRLGISSLTVREEDATQKNEAYANKFSIVLCDAPCSGLGVLGKKPDLRYANESRYQELLPIQSQILNNVSHYVQPGGLLQYSTCTLLKEENEDQVYTFLASHPEYSLEDFHTCGLESTNGMLTLLPFIHHTDGFFIAHLRKQ